MSELELSILMVDDDEADARLLEKQLSEIEAGWSTDFEYCNPLEDKVKEIVRENEFHVIFLDHKLGGDEDGISLLKSIRNSGYERPVVLLTGYGTDRVVAEAFREGVSDYLPKEDMEPETLNERIEYVLEDFFKGSVERTEQGLSWAGNKDSVTGFLNRVGFLNQLEESFEQQDHMALLLVSITNLARVNEVHSPAVGDEILRAVSKLISENLDTDALMSRPQGADFVLFLKGLGKAKVNTIGSRILNSFDEENMSFHPENTVPLRTEACVFENDDSVTSAERFLEQGLKKLAEVKSDGGGLRDQQ